MNNNTLNIIMQINKKFDNTNPPNCPKCGKQYEFINAKYTYVKPQDILHSEIYLCKKCNL